jgi:dTDP-4-amino-4,6-dideoxygalactose transaminase
MGIPRIECLTEVDSREWDELATRLGGNFFHCYAHAAYESSRPNVRPCFVKALDEFGECVGVAVSTISSPRCWPFSRYCLAATFATLPATREGTAESQRAILAMVEKEFKRKGIFSIDIGSCESSNSVQVLSALSYNLKNRAEFYIDLSLGLDEIWKRLTPECRNSIRKATRKGIKSRLEDSPSSLLQLQCLQSNALRRHGIKFQSRREDAQAAKEILLDKKRAVLLVGYLGESAVCAAMSCLFGGNAYYLFSGSSEGGRENAGPPLLIWKMIELLKAKSSTRMNLGGADGPPKNEHQTHGLYRFKRDFGTTVVSQPSGAKTISWLGATLNGALKSVKRLESMLVSFRQLVQKVCSYHYNVPWCVPAWGWNELRVTAKCFLAGKVRRGSYPTIFADAVREYLGVKYALPLGRGRVAIEVALRAMGVGDGDEVVVPSYICRTVMDPILRVGARPVFADVVAPGLHITPETVKAALTPHTKCVIVPHLFGTAARVDEIEKLLQGTGIQLIDDAAQSFGALCASRPVGTFGTCGIVSCGPGKALTGPSGGVLVTDNVELYERAAAMLLSNQSSATVFCRVLSFWTWRRFRKWTLPLSVLLNRLFKMDLDEEGAYLTSALSNLEAALALEQFRALRSNVQRRRQNAKVFLEALNGWSKYCISDLSHASVVLRLVLLLPQGGPDADWFVDSMAWSGVECQKGYTPLHLEFGNASGSLVNTEALWNRVVCIPIEIGVKKPPVLSLVANTISRRPQSEKQRG